MAGLTVKMADTINNHPQPPQQEELPQRRSAHTQVKPMNSVLVGMLLEASQLGANTQANKHHRWEDTDIQPKVCHNSLRTVCPNSQHTATQVWAVPLLSKLHMASRNMAHLRVDMSLQRQATQLQAWHLKAVSKA